MAGRPGIGSPTDHARDRGTAGGGADDVFRLSGHWDSADPANFELYLFEDNGALNDPTQWTSLIEDAITILVEIASAALPDVFATVAVTTRRLLSKRTMSFPLTTALRLGDEWLLRFTIDGATYGPVSLRWSN